MGMRPSFWICSSTSCSSRQVTHHPEVEELCDALAVLVAGKVVHTGTVAALVRDPHTGAKRSLEAALKSLYEKGQAA